MDYRIMGVDAWTPTGPDGQGRNRLTLYPGTPVARCMLRPSNWQAAWELHNRPSLAEPTLFGACTGSGDCATCPIANKRRTEYHRSPVMVGVVREFPSDGSVWILNRRDKGWGEFGYRHSSWAEFVQHENVFIGRCLVDEYGAYFEIV